MSFDKIGSWLSGICIVHCVLTPLFLVMFPFLTVAIATSETWEWGFIGFSVVIAFFALLQGYIYHKKPVPYLLAIVGFGVFIFAKVAFHEAFHFGIFTSALVYVGAGCAILTAHYLNHKWMHNAKCECGEHHCNVEEMDGPKASKSTN